MPAEAAGTRLSPACEERDMETKKKSQPICGDSVNELSTGLKRRTGRETAANRKEKVRSQKSLVRPRHQKETGEGPRACSIGVRP